MKKCPYCAERSRTRRRSADSAAGTWCGLPAPPSTMPYPQVAPMPYPQVAPMPPRTNGLAVASMVLGILCLYGIGSILALVFGYQAKGQIERSGGRQSGRGMAIAGIVLGWIGLALMAFLIIAVVSADHRTPAASRLLPAQPSTGRIMANSAGFNVIEMMEAATTSWKPFAGIRSRPSDVVATMKENSPICARPAATTSPSRSVA